MKLSFERGELLGAIAKFGTLAELSTTAGVNVRTVHRALSEKDLQIDSYLKICKTLDIKPNFKNFNFNGGMQNG